MEASYPVRGLDRPARQVATEPTSQTAVTLRVSGATLYCEVRGAAPALLLIHGGNGDIFPFKRMAQQLADRYKVITYVRRGFSRSLLNLPDYEQRLSTDADDAARVLSELADGQAHVFGSS